MIVAPATCYGQCTGEIWVYAQGAGQVFYQWLSIPGADSSYANGLCSGNYVVVITDSTGCTDIDSIEVTHPDSIGFTISVNNTTCPGGCTGSVTVNPFDTVPYTYYWPGYMANGPTLGTICQGIYTVIITDPQGCTAISSGEVGYDPPFDLSFTSNPASCLTSCNGSATVYATGIPPFTYQWDTGPIQSTQQAVNLCSGEYLVGVSDSTGCVVTDTVEITILPNPNLTIVADSPHCFGGCDGHATVQIFGPGFYLYEWNTSPVQSSQTANNLCAGMYTVQVTNVNTGCVYVDSVEITDPPPFTMNFTTNPSLCDNFCSGQATVFSNCGNPSYLWETGAVTPTINSVCPGIYSVTVTDNFGCSSNASVEVVSTELIFNVSDANCNNVCDGVAEVIFPPGSGWQATWSTIPAQNTPVITQLCAGNYSVTILDSTGGCSISGSVDIEEQQPIGHTLIAASETCPGSCDGSIILLLSGNGPFSLNWPALPGQFNDSVFSLCPGLYEVEITDSAGCNVADSIYVTEPVAPQFTFNSLENSCYNVCDASSVINPVTPGVFNYEWLTVPSQFGASASNLCPGFTYVEINTSAGCVYTDSVLIIGVYPMSLSFNIVPPTCNGLCDGFVECQVFGGTPDYEYAWSNGFFTQQSFNLCEGTYTVTVTDDNGCVESTNISLDDPDAIQIGFTMTEATCASCADGMISATVSGGTPNYNYYWTPGGIGGAVNDSLVPGLYNLCIADDHLCIYCEDILVTFTDGIYELNSTDNNVIVFPNPADEYAQLYIAGEHSTTVSDYFIRVIDVSGRTMGQAEIRSVTRLQSATQFTLDTRTLSQGLYFVNINDGNSNTFAGRILVQH